MALWQLMHLGTWCMVKHYWYQLTKERSRTQGRSVIKVAISNPRQISQKQNIYIYIIYIYIIYIYIYNIYI